MPISSSIPSPSSSYSTAIDPHLPFGYAYIIVGPDGSTFKPIQIHRGPDAVDHLLTGLLADEDILAAGLCHIMPMQLNHYKKIYAKKPLIALFAINL